MRLSWHKLWKNGTKLPDPELSWHISVKQTKVAVRSEFPVKVGKVALRSEFLTKVAKVVLKTEFPVKEAKVR